jgi:hypothetical protein
MKKYYEIFVLGLGGNASTMSSYPDSMDSGDVAAWLALRVSALMGVDLASVSKRYDGGRGFMMVDGIDTHEVIIASHTVH